jgi:ferritin-like protein
MAASTTLHESLDQLSAETRDLHRALTSLQEELEAVDWYRQRADAASDNELREVLLHNMREEIEHASMLLEWIRRREPAFDEKLRIYLFKTEPIVNIEIAEEQREAGSETG